MLNTTDSIKFCGLDIDQFYKIVRFLGFKPKVVKHNRYVEKFYSYSQLNKIRAESNKEKWILQSSQYMKSGSLE